MTKEELKKLLDISEAQKSRLKEQLKAVRKQNQDLRDKVKELLAG